MAKLRKIVIECRTERVYKYYETNMEYSAREQLFFVRVPPEQADVSLLNDEGLLLWGSISLTSRKHVDAFIGPTEKEVLEKAESYYEIYLLADRSERKMIIYYFAYEIPGLVSDRTRRQGRTSIPHRLEVDFMVVKEITIGGVSRYIRQGEYIGDTDVTILVGRWGDYSLLEWTESREAFFTNMMEGMESLVKKIHENTFEPEALVKMIEGGQALLSAPKG